MDEMDKSLEDFKRKVDVKTQQVVTQTDKGIVKAAFFAEGKAKENAMNEIYNNPVPFNRSGNPRYKRTGLYKASIGSGINPNQPHSAIVYNMSPYAKYLEFGTSRGIKGRYILVNAVSKNKEDIKKIIKSHISEVTK